MKKLPAFIKLPSRWIEDGGLRAFSWSASKSDETAALMLLTVIAHHADLEEGTAELTYDQLEDRAGISRAKIAGGLAILEGRKVIRRLQGRSCYALENYDPKRDWAMFPARGLYSNGSISAFQDFKLRSPSELDALKLYFLFAARRDHRINMAPISYVKIEEYCGVAKIKAALSILNTTGLIYTERFASRLSESGIAHAYRLVHLEGRKHLGTIGRDSDFDFGITGFPEEI